MARCKRISRQEARRLGALAAERVRQGKLFLRHVLGLTDDEMAAIADAAEQLRRTGRLREAVTVYGLLIAQEPLCAAYWRATAGLYQRLGQHAVAVACYEVLALLDDRDASVIRQEATCLQQLGERDLAAQLREFALSLTTEKQATGARST